MHNTWRSRATPELTTGDQQRQVVTTGSVTGVRPHGPEDAIDNRLRRLATQRPHQVQDPLLTQPPVLPIARIRHAIGEEEEHVAIGAPLTFTDRWVFLRHPEWRVQRAETLE